MKDILDYFSYMPPSTAEGILQAVQPIVQLETSFLDQEILILRKAMFNKYHIYLDIYLQGARCSVECCRRHSPSFEGHSSSMKFSTWNFNLINIYISIYMN